MFIFFGPVRYNSVDTKYKYFNVNGVNYEVAKLTCEGEGPNKCQKTPPKDRVFSNGHYIPREPLVNTENEMIEDISNLLVEKETFQPEGKMTRTVCVKGEKGEMLTFFFFATWRKGTIEGNAEIVIETFDITDEIKLK